MRKSGHAARALLFPIQFFLIGLLSAQPGSRYTANFNNSYELLTDGGGRPINLRVDYNMEGTPFFPPEYSRADIIVKTGRTYRGILVKFNLSGNLLLLKMPDGAELVATDFIRRLIFTDTAQGEIIFKNVFERGFPKIDGLDENIFYEVLDTGKLKLLKYHSVTYLDQRPYGQASITRVFEQTETYYVLAEGGTMKKLEKGREALLSVITEKKEEFSRYIESRNLKCRKESEWKNAIAYYNSLFRRGF